MMNQIFFVIVIRQGFTDSLQILFLNNKCSNILYYNNDNFSKSSEEFNY